MTREALLEQAEKFVRQELAMDSSGHDWWHVDRVTRLARHIAEQESADVYICELAALLHDIADDKLNASEEAGLAKVRTWLIEHEVDDAVIVRVLDIIGAISFRGGDRPPVRTLEGKIVQDADRLDAIGAVGIARALAYSGAKGQPIHDPDVPLRTKMTLEEYRNGKSTAINHFAEKLLKLKNLMNTEFGRRLAVERHQFMEEYLKQFSSEWKGEK